MLFFEGGWRERAFRRFRRKRRGLFRGRIGASKISRRYLGIKRGGVGGGFEPVGGGISRNKMGSDGNESCGHTEGGARVATKIV